MELQYKDKKITPNLNPEKMKIDIKNVNELLGVELKEKEVKTLIKKMGHNYSKGIVETPAWRTDMLHEVDLIEDIAIAYGYENFVPEIPEVATTGEIDKKEIIKRKIGEILSGLNLIEVSNYHLTTKADQFRNMIIPEEKVIEVENSKTDFTILRKDLTHYMMKILSENVDCEYPQKIFEVGKVFTPAETDNLALAIDPANFTEVRQILEYLFRMLNINVKIIEPEKVPNYFIDGRTAEIKLEEKTIGFIGEIHPKILRNWKIKMPVSLFEINLEEIFKKLD
jgi:phenylalanyl-tRNA synthetase beta chain